MANDKNFKVKNGLSLAENLVFEGSTTDTFQTTVTATDPTADRTITLPDSSGTVALSGSSLNVGDDGEIIFGTTASAPKIVGDATYTDLYFYDVGNATDARMILSGSGLTLNGGDIFVKQGTYLTELRFATPTANRIINIPDSGGNMLLNIVEDTTPMLGGLLDLDNNTIRDSGTMLFEQDSLSGNIVFQNAGEEWIFKDNDFTPSELMAFRATGTRSIGIEFTGSLPTIKTPGNLRVDASSFTVYDSANTTTILSASNGSGVQVYKDIYLGANADIVFEGSTYNTSETTLTVAEPTADRTITFPDASGTVMLAAAGYSLYEDTGDMTIAVEDVGAEILFQSESETFRFQDENANNRVSIERVGNRSVSLNFHNTAPTIFGGGNMQHWFATHDFMSADGSTSFLNLSATSVTANKRLIKLGGADTEKFSTSTATSFGLDPNNGGMQRLTVSTSTTTVTPSNFNNATVVLLRVVNTNGTTVNWNSNITWWSGTAPTLSTDAQGTMLVFWNDTGTTNTIYGSVVTA